MTIRQIVSPCTIVILVFSLILAGCATVSHQPQQHTVYKVDGDSLLEQQAPVFITEGTEYPYNRIGTVTATIEEDGKIDVFVDPEQATVYAETRNWRGKYDTYTNLIYRIHFTEIPSTFCPFYLGAGENVGLFVIISLNSNMQPVLITTVHTCGCYLAFIPTSSLPEDRFPKNWNYGRNFIYGEYLPGIIETKNAADQKLYILLRQGNHRIKEIWIKNRQSPTPSIRQALGLAPLHRLSNLPLANGETTSFFVTSGSRKEYVRDSEKLRERFLISWWALDWRVGEDKRLGKSIHDGITFYTSLKPWDRDDSDMRDFANFLRYWGWEL